jgi:hypothetical protein
MPQGDAEELILTQNDDDKQPPLTAPYRRPLSWLPTPKIQRDQRDKSHGGLVHNHPSGDPSPSRADIEMTRAIAEVARPLGIAVHDHLIVGKDGHASLKALKLI